jgi:hypothetical protein
MSPSSDSTDRNDLATQLLTLLLAAVCASRFLVPTELPWRGGTIGLSGCTLLVSAAWWLARLWKRDEWKRDESRRLDWLDAGGWLLLVGQIASSLWLCIFASGDCHAAMVVLVEWFAVLSAAVLLRDVTRSALQRGDAVSSWVGLIVGLSVLGIWQHHYQYESLIAEYRPLQARFETMVKTGVPDPGLLAEFARREIPTDPGALKLWEQRLFSSREPLGMFALANSFAGVLLVGFLLIVCAVVARPGGPGTSESGESATKPTKTNMPRGSSIGVWIIAAICAAGVGWCLLLTKSRTGFAGTLAGSGVMVVSALLATRHRGRMLAAVAAAAMIGTAVVSVAFVTGGLDRFVLSEAGKSLRYRLEYWTGTTRMLSESTESFLLGVGPGNFRQRYLRHKLPESSEEIADPHNLILDAWSSGGVASLAGLLLVIGSGVAAGIRRRGGTSGPHASPGAAAAESSIGGRENRAALKSASTSEPMRIDPWLAGMVLACLVTAIQTEDYERLAVIGATATAATVALRRGFDWSALPAGAFAAAFCGLTVHLMGAGGIAMPAISLLWFSLAGWGQSAVESRARERVATAGVVSVNLGWLKINRWLQPTVWLFLSGLAFGAVVMVVQANIALDEGDYQWRERGDLDRAKAGFERAAALAPWQPEPRMKLAELHRQSVLAFPRESRNHWTDVVRWQSEGIALDPANPAAYEQAAVRFADAAASPLVPGDATEFRRLALDMISTAVSRYPNGIRVRKQAALIADSLGETSLAAEHARAALELHRLAEEYGHTDKLLSDDVQVRLRTIVARGKR